MGGRAAAQVGWKDRVGATVNYSQDLTSNGIYPSGFWTRLGCVNPFSKTPFLSFGMGTLCLFYRCILEAYNLFSRFHSSTDGKEFCPRVDHTESHPYHY